MIEEKEVKERMEAKGYVEYFAVVVDPKQTPTRLDKFLMDKLEKVSRNRIQNAITDGSILVNFKEVKSNYKTRPNDLIKIYLPKSDGEREVINPENIPLDIRYEDDYLMVVHKPAGLVVHPGVGNWSGTLVNGLRYYLGQVDIPTMEGNPPDRAGLVHRIDKDTSGLLVIAKKPEAMTHLSKQFFDHKIERKYIALVWGQPDPEEGTITGYIGRDIYDRKRMKLYEEEDQGKHSVTHYKIIEKMYYVSLVECVLETGRTHQIRVHMLSEGHPLFNDKKYEGNRIRKGTVFSKYKQFVDNAFKMLPRHALHAASLGFIHPETGEKMYFESELPEDMTNVLDKWRAYVHSRKELL